MKFLFRIFCVALFILIFKSNFVVSQWVVEFTPYQFSSPRFINVPDTGTLWGLNYIGYWDTMGITKKTVQYGWEPYIITDLPYFTQHTSIAGVNDDTAFVGNLYGKIYKTTNGGYNFTEILSAGQTYIVTDIQFSKINKNFGYIVCSSQNTPGNFKIYKTSDFGESWIIYTPNFGAGYSANNIMNVSVTDSSHLYIGLWCNQFSCPYIRMAYTTNGGLNWQTSDMDPGRRGVAAIAFKDDNQTGILVSYLINQPHKIYRTTNGGQNWNFIDTFSFSIITGLASAFQTSVWYITGKDYRTNKYFIYKSINDGTSWQQMTFDSTVGIIDDIDVLTFNGKIYAWATSSYSILKLVDTAVVIGVNNEGSIIPDKYGLEQNFPNPFNPNSIIRYAIPKNSYVTIKVYDLQGREIAVIINNELKSAGKYFVNFDGSNFASGVYFYMLESGDLVSTKKMVLVK